MDLEQLEVLETKISQAVQVIEQLKSKNKQLSDEIGQLRNEAESRETLLNKLMEENRRYQQEQEQASLGKEKEERIRNKVEEMLSKLDELEETA
jgi:FtsZ-binding cell division protein ZapB